MFYREQLIFASQGRSNYRIPTVIVTNNGTVLAFCNDRKDTLSDHAEEVSLVLRKKCLGEAWSEEKTLASLEGWACKIGSAVYDREIGKAILFFERNPVAKNEFGKYTEEELSEMKRRAAEARADAEQRGIPVGSCMFTSVDDGTTWVERPAVVLPVEQQHWDGTKTPVVGQTHGAAHGIQLRYSSYKGRLLCAARTSIGTYNDWAGLRKCVYNNAIYSDDHGESWQTANCVQLGTGEGTLIENADGTVLYNSRAYFKDQKRYLATSFDGGATYEDFRTDDFLIEEANIGCNASFIRVPLEDIRNRILLPDGAQDVTVFCNPRSVKRENMTACVSFDAGKSWSLTKTVCEGPSAYSSLEFNPIDQHFYLIYEKGKGDSSNPYSAGVSAAEFDLEWLLTP